MCQLNMPAQAIRLTLLHERAMEAILKKVKGSNTSGGNIVNSTGIKMVNDHPLKGFQLQRYKRDRKKGFVIIMMRSTSLTINVKGKADFSIRW